MTDLRLSGVLGWPVGHSRSPRLHRHWIERHGVAADYVALPVAPGDLAGAVAALPRLGFRGVNVTVPHKEAALAAADEATARAAVMGAANVLTFEDGRVVADNTDGVGFIENVRDAAPGWDAGAGPAVVLGAGGAARAVAAALLDAGAPLVVLLNRTRERAEVLAQDLADRMDAGDRLAVEDWVQAGNAVEAGATVVNATSLGMDGQPGLRVPLDGLHPGQVVADLVYAPLDTRLLREARAAGAVAVDGLGMLLQQAAPAFAAWWGVAPAVDGDARAAALG